MDYFEKVHSLSFSIWKMLLWCAVVLAILGILSKVAGKITAASSRSSRENCQVVSVNFVGVGATKDEDAQVNIRASCSFRDVIASSTELKTVLAYAVNRPSSISCYQNKYQYSTAFRCSL